jgi:hypothetical protein
LAELNGKMYCVGGSDGSQSLKSTEYYDEATESWVLGPSLITARSIVSVAAINNRLYAIGGFSGKKFLNTIEYFDEEANEWTKFAKLQPIMTSSSSNIDSEEEDKNDIIRNDLNEDVIKDLKQKATLKISEKDKIREDESESTAIIMPL